MEKEQYIMQLYIAINRLWMGEYFLNEKTCLYFLDEMLRKPVSSKNKDTSFVVQELTLYPKIAWKEQSIYLQ